MTEVCVTWKQPDGDHFNGFCTNRFRQVTPPSGVKISGGCELCVNPITVEPPMSCAGCPDAPEEGEWPLNYTIRGAAMTAPSATIGTYVTTSENANGLIERTVHVNDVEWDEIASIINGGRLVRTESSVGVPECYWRYCSAEQFVFRRGVAVNQNAGTNNCFVARDRAASLDTITSLGRVVSPIHRYYLGSSSPPDPASLIHLGCVLSHAFGDNDNGLPSNWYPPFVVQWPAGFGVLSGTNLGDSEGSATTLDPLFPDCPTLIGHPYYFTGYSQAKQLAITVGMGSGTVILTVSIIQNVRTENITYWNKITSEWEAGSVPGFPSVPASGAPDQPYGMVYYGTVDCLNKGYLKLYKDLILSDPLGCYPDEIELIGGVT